MELYQLKSLVAVAEEGNLRKAAERIFASQPAVSGHIKALEEELGLALFERTRLGMLLTPDGERIHKIAIRMLADARDMGKVARNLSQEVAGTLHVGINNDGRHHKLDKTAAKLAVSCPELQLDFESGSSGAILKGIRNEDLDLGYIELIPEEGDVTLIPLFYNEPVIIYPAKWHDDLKTDDWDALMAKPWSFVSEDCSYYKLMHKAVDSRRLKLDWRYRADHEQVAVSLATGGVAVSLVSLDMAQPEVDAGKVCIWQHFSPVLTVHLAFLSHRAQERRIRAYVQAVAELFAGPPKRADVV